MDQKTSLSFIFQAFVIAFVSEFIPRVYYQIRESPDGSMKGFLNFTLSCFDVADFAGTRAEPNFNFSYPTNSCGFGKKTCR